MSRDTYRVQTSDAAWVQLRLAEPGDEPAVADIHVRSWQVAYRGLMSDEYLDGLRPEDRAIRYTFADQGPGRPSTWLAVDGSVVCGFATVGPCADDPDGAGELYALYLDPGRWDRGVGRMLIAQARAHLVEAGFSEAVLWVLVGNERAERFYRLDGWRSEGERRTDEVHGITVEELRYRRSLS
jgi:ribosomal protein S18 acetylase RimI-like enzyme